MPGRLLIMNQNGVEGATVARDSEGRRRSHDSKLVNGERSTPRPDGPVAAPTANGPAGLSGANGPADRPSTNGAMASITAQMGQLPPELQHCASEHYHPLSKLLSRMAQECFNDLGEMLTSMADIPSAQPNGLLPNGMGTHTGVNSLPDNSDANRQKKLLMMKFAHDNRGKFIKVLVLFEWARKASRDIVKMVDVNQWIQEQLVQGDHVTYDIYHTKMALAGMRQPNPDIRTALEILSAGKASWIPDLGFIPPEPMSSEKSRKLLRYMNTSLAIRLNIHETLPRHLRNWRIASGRASFVVPGEFELDATAFSEDASDQWHFIDIRLLFSPAPIVAADGQFYAFVKRQLDSILRQSGLSACFDFLHNFILTHKVSILRSQAFDLLRADWAGALRVEPVHRSLVVQYWLDRPGRKSWVEIGLSSGRSRNDKTSWRGSGVASLAIRWFRQGVEVKGIDLKVDWNNLSIERILKRVIALHVAHLLRSARNQITLRLAPRSWTKVNSVLSETEPCDCSLELSLGTLQNKTRVSIDPVTGRFELRPCTPPTARAERAINQSKDPLVTVSTALPHLLSSSLQDLIQQCAHRLGWKSATRYALRVDTVKHAVKLDVMQFALYAPRGWAPKTPGGMTTKWALAAVIDPAGESWWIFELGSRGTTVEFAEQVTTESLGQHKLPTNQKTLASIERIAAQFICFRVTDRALQKRGIPSFLERQLALRSITPRSGASQAALHGWVLRLRAPDLLNSKPHDEQWIESGLRITCHGFRTDYRNVWHIVSGTMIKSADIDMQKLMAGSTQKDITFSDNGAFSILLSTPFGEPIINQVTARLREIDRLRSFAITLKKRKMKLRASSLEQVEFQYGKDSKATVNFNQKGGIKVVFQDTNPHYRVRTFLNNIINEKSPGPPALRQDDHSALDRFCTTLMYTRPMIRIIDELQAGNPGNVKDPAIHAHSMGTYRFTYNNPMCSFDVRIRPKQDATYWHIEDNDGQESRPSAERNPNHKRIESLKTALHVLFRSQGEGWIGVRSGIIAELDGVPNALKKLQETVLSCAVEGGPEKNDNESSATLPNGKPKPPENGTIGVVNMQTQHDVITID